MNPPGCIDEIFTLWDDLADLGPRASQQALNQCLGTLCKLLNAQNSFWIGVVRVLDGEDARADATSGWRFGAMQPGPRYTPPPADRGTLKVIHTDEEARWSRAKPAPANNAGDAGEIIVKLVASAGQFRADTLRSGRLVRDLAAFEATAHYDFYYRSNGIHDRIWVLFPVGPAAESVFCFDRVGDAPAFSPEDLNLAIFALRGIKWFHRQILMSHGLGVSDAPLSPVEHSMVKLLLSGAAEKAIAEAMGMTPGTVHQYVTRIYKKFGKRGRNEFTALWLGAGR